MNVANTAHVRKEHLSSLESCFVKCGENQQTCLTDRTWSTSKGNQFLLQVATLFDFIPWSGQHVIN